MKYLSKELEQVTSILSLELKVILLNIVLWIILCTQIISHYVSKLKPDPVSYQMFTYPIIQLLATNSRATTLQKTRLEYWLNVVALARGQTINLFPGFSTFLSS